MALPDTLKIVLGTPLVFSNSGEYSPADAGQPTGTDADIDLGALASGGVARQSVKLDIGSANLDALFRMKAYIEWHSAPTAGGVVDFYLGWSNDPTAGEDNTANLSGTDAAFQGYGADTASGTEALKQLDYIGSLTCTADADVQVGFVGEFQAMARYCCLVVVNNSSVNLANTDAIETCVAMWPLQYQVQDEVIEQYEVIIDPETRTDKGGEYLYVAVAGWESLADKQANKGIERTIRGQKRTAQLFNDFKVRYATTARDTSAEIQGCIERYLQRIATSAVYREKVRQQPDRRGTTLNLQVNDDAHDNWYEEGFAFLGGTSFKIGDFSGATNGFFRFASVSGLSGSTIDSADFQFWETTNADDYRAGDALCNMSCEAAEAPTYPANITAAESASRTTAFTAVDGQFTSTADQWQTISITSAVQEVADAFDPAVLHVIFDDDGSATNKYYIGTRHNSDNAKAAKLDIDYTAAGGGGAIPPHAIYSTRQAINRAANY